MSFLAPIALRLLQDASVSRPCHTDASVLECNPGIPDCCTSVSQELVPDVCAYHDSVYQPPQTLIWVLILAFGTTAFMAFGIGANDAANAWGTSVGSGAISLLNACVLGGLMDWLGAITLGSGVSDTISKGVADIHKADCWACGYCNSSMSLYMLGMMCALLATAVFLLLASFTAMPVSTTHAVVGAVVGVTIVGTRAGCLNYEGIGKIALSWIASPLLSGVIASTMYFFLNWAIMSSDDCEERALLASPFLFSATMMVMTSLILMKSNLTRDLPMILALVVATGVAVATFFIARLYVVKEIRKHLQTSEVSERETEIELPSNTNPFVVDTLGQDTNPFTIDEDENSDSAHHLKSAGPSGHHQRADGTPTPSPAHVAAVENAEALAEGDMEDVWGAVLPPQPSLGTTAAVLGVHVSEDFSEAQQRALLVFRFLLVFVAALESFAHGANDTGNATGAFSAVWNTYKNGLDTCSANSTPVWILAVGGFFVFLGVVCFGRRVIETVGVGLTQINFLRGFCIEFASTVSVVLATIVGMPVSTTHCQVGAVVFVGATSFGVKSVQWRLFGWIVLTWLVTLPAAGGLAAALMAALQRTIAT